MRITKDATIQTCLVWCLLSLLAVTTAANAQTLYGAESGTNSALYIIDPATGLGTPVGNIGFGLSALAAHPATGVLYGVSAPGGAGTRNLLRIDTATGAGTVIGPVGLGNFGIADMTFRADGTLFAWSENSDDLITINITTGAGTIVANAAISTFGSGLAFDAGGALWLAGRGSSGALLTVNPATGLTTVVVPAMKFHPVTGVLYAINKIRFPGEVGGSASNLVTINTTTGVITNIGATLARADALAFVPFISPPPPPPPTTFPPSFVGSISDQMVPQNGSVTVPFRITGAVISNALRVSLASSNTTLLQVGPTSLTATCGADGSCTLRITPEDGRAGTSTVTVTVTDGFFTTSISFLVTVVAVRPSTPAVVLANVVGSGIVLTWTASDTGTPIAYAIAWGTSAGASNLPVQLVPGTSTRFEFNAVPAGTYFFRVYAVGTGDLSAPSQTSATVTGSTAPGPPLALIGFPGNGSVNASWTAPLIGATPSIYEVQVGTSLGASDVSSATTAALSFGTGAGPGSYWVRTRAASGGAVGAWSSSIQVPVGGGACAGPPGAPVMLPVTTTSGLVTFTWWPGNGTAASYQVLLAPGLGLASVATFATGSPGTSFVWGSTGGSFAARVVATNACGSSPQSNQVAFAIQ